LFAASFRSTTSGAITRCSHIMDMPNSYLQVGDLGQMVGQILTVPISNPGDVVDAILLARDHLPYFLKALMQFHIL
jgi:hypothetical protein